jgi:hypothetical protein
MDGSLSRKERRKLVSLARHDVRGEAILACRNGMTLVMKRVSPRGAKYDRILDSELVAHARDEVLRLKGRTAEVSSSVS